MNIRETLSKIVAPELNLLYTVPPFRRVENGELDCGWSCREHALHVSVLCALLGIACDIRLGDFSLETPVTQFVASGDEGDGHAWCKIKEVLPVDLSMTFELFQNGAGPQLSSMVWGQGRNGDYFVSYHRHDQAVPETNHTYRVTFTEHQVISFSASDLTKNPYLFLFDPNPDDSLNWDALYGTDIYAKISLHCLRVASREIKPLHRSMKSSEAIKWIRANYSGATEKILSRIIEA